MRDVIRTRLAAWMLFTTRLFYSVAQSCETMHSCFCFLLKMSFIFLTQQGDTALHMALSGEHLALAKLLLELMTREAALSLNQVSSSGLGASCMHMRAVSDN